MISIIIPTKNEERLLPLLLDSLKQQDCASKLEVIVSDAFSTDRTRTVAKSYHDAFARVLVVDGGMPAVGRNRGAAQASGDLLFFIDADLILDDPKFISRAETIFYEKGLSVSSVYLTPISKRFVDHVLTRMYNVTLRLSCYMRPMGAMCIIVTKAAFESAGGYPEDVVMSEDNDFVYTVSRSGAYRVLPLYARYSVRRLDKEGRLKFIAKNMTVSIYNMLFGPLRKSLFTYEFKYDDDMV